MKKRKFANGGDLSDKELGLKASGDEKVGFFERLRMGNIDDPSSEAYKKFGAGRGQAERQKMKDDADFAAEEAREATMRKVSGQEPKMTGSPDIPVTPAAPSTAAVEKKPSFGAAFAAAREGGEKTFMWNGKKYTTEMKGEAKPAAKAAPKAEASSAGNIKAYSMAAHKAAPKAAPSSAANIKAHSMAAHKNTPKAKPSSMKGDVEKFNPAAVKPRSMAPTKNNTAEMDNKLTSDRYKGRRAGFDAKMKKTTAGKTSDYKAGGSVRGAGIAQRGVKKCRMM